MNKNQTFENSGAGILSLEQKPAKHKLGIDKITHGGIAKFESAVTISILVDFTVISNFKIEYSFITALFKQIF